MRLECRSARMAWPAWRACATLLFVTVGSLASAKAATAAGAEPLDVLIVPAPPGAAFERLQGQLIDLSVHILDPGTMPEPARLVEERVARQLGLARSADIVIWYRTEAPDSDRLLLYVAEMARAETVERAVGGGARRASGPSSATLEAAALAVREVVQAFIAAAAVRSAESQMTEQADTRESRTVRSPQGSPPGPGLSWSVELEWSALDDGVATPVHHGPGLGVGIAPGALRAGVLFRLGLPVTIGTNYGDLDIARHAASAWLGMAHRLAAGFELVGRVHGGILIYDRDAIETPEGVLATSDNTFVAALVGAEGRLSGSIRRDSIRWVLGLGLDATPGELRLGYEVEGAFRSALTTRRLQPRVGVGLEFSAR